MTAADGFLAGLALGVWLVAVWRWWRGVRQYVIPLDRLWEDHER